MSRAAVDGATLLHGDCLELLRTLADGSVDAVVTDPPYGLKFMGRRWDCDVPGADVWAECLRALKPGGHMLVFSGTRTQHRMATRIEDAGFEIRDMIAWVYGNGFPKSLDVSKAIDRAAGAEMDVIGEDPWADRHRNPRGNTVYGNDCNSPNRPVTEAARQWQGWGTSLKPALEPITLARKPLAGTVAANVLGHGTGALNVDGCRVESQEATGWGGSGSALHEGGLSLAGGDARPVLGRFPANLIHDGSHDVTSLFPESSSGARGGLRIGSDFYGGYNGGDSGKRWKQNSGSAARFFYSTKASRLDRHYGLKGSAAQPGGMNTHPTVKPVDLMRYLCRLITPPGGTVLDPFMGSGSTGIAALQEGFAFIGMEKEQEYFEIARQRIKARTACIQRRLF